ncbi:MAG: HPr family phosphocarrier protein [Planctomycetes bacterium]|nr:HPr family phosphocarrier protein [Planctomycetota bacterium]
MSEKATERVRICNEQGLHARPSALIVKAAGDFAAAIWLRNEDNGVEADAKRLMEVMMLAAPKGTELVIEAEGADARAAVERLRELVARGFDES